MEYFNGILAWRFDPVVDFGKKNGLETLGHKQIDNLKTSLAKNWQDI